MDEKETKAATSIAAPRRGGRPRRETQIVETRTIPDGQIFKQTVDGVEFTFQFRNGKLEPVEQRKLHEGEIRYFRLRVIPGNQRKNRTCRRYYYNPGPGHKLLRFWQRNFEGEKRDPKKENVHQVEDSNLGRIFGTMTDTFEECTENEWEASRKTVDPQGDEK